MSKQYSISNPLSFYLDVYVKDSMQVPDTSAVKISISHPIILATVNVDRGQAKCCPLGWRPRRGKG